MDPNNLFDILNAVSYLLTIHLRVLVMSVLFLDLFHNSITPDVLKCGGGECGNS